MIDFKTIETFLWVANLRSFRGAAEKLNTTQPTPTTTKPDAIKRSRRSGQ